MLKRLIAVRHVGIRAIAMNSKQASSSRKIESLFQTEAWKMFLDNARRGVEAEVKEKFASYKIWFLGCFAATAATVFSAAATTVITIITVIKQDNKREFKMLEMKLRGGSGLHVSDKECQFNGDRFKEVAVMISSMCVNAETKRPYPASEIEKALREHPGFSFKPDLSSRQHALEAIPMLREKMKIERAKMRVRVLVPSKYAKAVHGELKAQFDAVEDENWDKGDLTMVGLIPLSNYKAVLEIVRSGDQKSYGELTYLD